MNQNKKRERRIALFSKDKTALFDFPAFKIIAFIRAEADGKALFRERAGLRD